ncbi:sensor histidine kinase [Peptostreptococcus canis]|uniref:histidine kinase n=1 Tax=Peptostreptococcus canis TaxID=1159213 RepID=A0ABR6TIU0_9FIRM|nr:HAMP domain-containing sensor histidine kinase [Peptostreptococcus canis]MBC2575153.1 HAMP domain-containing histidine kinase [Peptostreptococcus canis]MBP1997673.1 signal transduction histidine kinase [Peptostreptococcus canis]
MKIENKKSLSKTILLAPIIIVVISFFIISLSFQFVIDKHINSITEGGIKSEFEDLDLIYRNEDMIPYSSEEESEEEPLIVPTKYIILDENYNLIFPDKEWTFQKERKIALRIAKYFLENKNLPQKGISQKIEINNRTLLIKSKKYRGIYEGMYVVEPDSVQLDVDNQKVSDYHVLVYADISPIQRLINDINKILIALLIVSGLLSIFVMLHILKKVTLSFKGLNNYLIKVGKKEDISEIPNFTYDEFSNVVDTVVSMSKQISKSEQIQKQFFQNASHELRTPLMSIQGYAEGLKYDVIKDKQNAYDIIISESDKMTKLVDEILFLSKFESEAPKKERIKVSEILYDCASSMDSIAKERNIEFAFDIDGDFTIIGDEDMIQRAFSNIISNAIRYAKSKIDIECKSEGEKLYLSIKDDGCGILEEDLPHIFERFYKGKGGKFGIGLSMAKEIIGKHSGVIYVDSKFGSTIFTIELPLNSYE